MTAKEPLSVTHPELAKQAVGWDPSTVSRGSVKKLDWRCSQGHEWTTTPNSRTNQESGCPFCSGKYLLVGFNDLATTHPKISKEAFEWDPKSLGKGSLLKKVWACDGHNYTARVADRVSGTSCPYCAGRKVLIGFNDLATTHPDIASEAQGWDPKLYSKGSSNIKSWVCNHGHKYQMDIASRTGRGSGCPVCAGKKVLVGSNDLHGIHPEIANEAYGWDPRTVTSGSARLKMWKCSQGHIWKAQISSRVGNQSGCPVCSGRQVLEGFNDLLTTHPPLSAEAYKWDPLTVSYGSEKKLRWRCEHGHIWTASVTTRSRGSGCPSCSGHRVELGYNDLESTHPDIASQADGWNPKLFSKGSHERVQWKCNKGHTWRATIKSRGTSGCPICNNKIVLIGFNDLVTTHPGIAIEAYGWDPSTLTFGSAKRKSWKCAQGHIWETTVASRQNDGCAICSGRKVLFGLNDLTTTNPDLASQADGWDPKKYSAGSGKLLLWRCSLEHTWKATIASRAKRQLSCPICSGKRVLAGFNDLATTHPELANQAVDWDPTKFSAGSGKKMLWICSEGHKWATRVMSRKSGSGCPSCSLTQYDPNEKGWLYFLEQQEWQLLQIGITNQPGKRLAKHARLGWKLIELRGPMDGFIARAWETSILQMLKRNGAKLGPEEVAGKFDGYTEAWIESSFEAKSLRELMNAVEKDEE